ncbi:pentatricopeptide repeat-containing protein [Sesbania bispinosa]|nr:pentatricopeptide repeat-containing protein [Sesbania bispinosa]
MSSDALDVLKDFLAEQQSHLVADSNAGDSEIALVIRHGLDSDVYVLNALVTCYFRYDEIGLARNVFNGIGDIQISDQPA